MHTALLIEHEAAKEILEACTDPEPQAYKDFMVRYEEFKVVHKLMLEYAKEVQDEKDFIDWHMANNVMPDYETAIQNLKVVVGQ